MHGGGSVSDVLGALEHSECQTGQKISGWEQARHWTQRKSCALCMCVQGDGGEGTVSKRESENQTLIGEVDIRRASVFMYLFFSFCLIPFLPLRKRDTSSSWGMLSGLYPQCLSRRQKASRYSLQAWVVYKSLRVEYTSRLNQDLIT